MKTATADKPRTLRWTVDEYDRLASDGFFVGKRVELVAGRIYQMAPRFEPHVAAVSLSAKALEQAFGPHFWVRRQDPLHLGNRSKPEPDIAVVAGSENDTIDTGAPTTALLVVEVADSSLRLDRGRRARVFARHGIADYWIVNLIDRQLEVHRSPGADPNDPSRFRYGTVQILKLEQFVTPLGAPQSSIPVAALFPRQPAKPKE